MKPSYILNDQTHSIDIIHQRDNILLSINNRQVSCHIHRLSKHHGLLTIDGTQKEIYTAQDGDKLFIHLDGKVFHITAINPFTEATNESGSGSGNITAPMPGVMLQIFVKAGDKVALNQPILLFESMKIQTQVTAHVAGRIDKIHYEAGQSFDKGVVLVEILNEVSD